MRMRRITKSINRGQGVQTLRGRAHGGAFWAELEAISRKTKEADKKARKLKNVP